MVTYLAEFALNLIWVFGETSMQNVFTAGVFVCLLSHVSSGVETKDDALCV